jgi:fructuronate reductase
MLRLSDPTLASLPARVRRPDYDRTAVTPGIVHLGAGAFYRAHGAVYTDAVLAREPGWGIVAASLRSAETRDALSPQNGLYTLAVRSGEGEDLRVVGSIIKLLAAPADTAVLLAAMSDPRLRIVTLTITEKGYCHDPATGALNETHPDIVHDLAGQTTPRSAPGLIVEALRRRRTAGVRPFTVLSCDNLPSNGVVTKRILDRFAELRDADLGAYTRGELLAPSTMVDRITPATTDDDRARIAAELGVLDAWPVMTEPFSQWVIEDRFAAGRPHWDAAGAQFVANVGPYELMKLRLLNGAHSTLAYLGSLAGYETISDVMADPAFAALAAGVMDDATPTLTMPPGVDLAAYRGALLDRFRNPALKHRTAQIAMDGSQKLPQRLLATIRDCLRLGLPFRHLALGVAGWLRYVIGRDERDHPIQVRDPMAERIAGLAVRAGNSPEDLAAALFGVTEVFGSDLRDDPRFTGAVTAALGELMAFGAKAAVARHCP